MAPKNKFTREEMVAAAVRVVQKMGAAALTAKSLAEELGTSTQPVFTCFGTMDTAKAEVYDAAERVFDEYLTEGLKQEIPFFGIGTQYIRFAREEPELYRLLFLMRSDDRGSDAFAAMRHMQELGPPLANRYLLYRRTGGGSLFPRPLAGGSQPRYVDRNRRLPLFRQGDRADPDRLQRQHFQGN